MVPEGRWRWACHPDKESEKTARQRPLLSTRAPSRLDPAHLPSSIPLTSHHNPLLTRVPICFQHVVIYFIRKKTPGLQKWLCRRGDPCLDPQHPCKEPAVAVRASNSTAGKAEMSGSLHSPGQPVQLNEQNSGGDQEGKTPHVLPWAPHP